MNTERGAEQVECRLTIDGVTITFQLAGPLVAMAPAAEKQPKRTSRRGAK